MKVPRPKVNVIMWSRYMHLKRPHEVNISDPNNEESGEDMPIKRFATKKEAQAFAVRLRALLKE